jgi:hypothetical protein
VVAAVRAGVVQEVPDVLWLATVLTKVFVWLTCTV